MVLLLKIATFSSSPPLQIRFMLLMWRKNSWGNGPWNIRILCPEDIRNFLEKWLVFPSHHPLLHRLLLSIAPGIFRIPYFSCTFSCNDLPTLSFWFQFSYLQYYMFLLHRYGLLHYNSEVVVLLLECWPFDYPVIVQLI